MSTYKSLLTILMLFVSLSVTAEETYNLSVKLATIKNDKGSIFIELYSDPATFRKSAKALKIIKLPAAEGSLTATFDKLGAGTYAVLCYHDEDGNNTMNKRFGMRQCNHIQPGNNRASPRHGRFPAVPIRHSQGCERTPLFLIPNTRAGR